jgi:hypothetical protein
VTACDHLLWGGASLETAVEALEELTGVRPAFGGRHPDLGTHNAVAALGPKTFVEVIAPDPAVRPGAVARQLAALKRPRLIMWAARTRSAADVAERAKAEGYQAAVVDGHRVRADGVTLRWTNVFVGGHGAGTLVPFFIEWREGPHPADDAPTGLHLHAFHAESPQPEALRAILQALGVRLPVRKGPHDRLVATLDTPRGRVELSGP